MLAVSSHGGESSLVSLRLIRTLALSSWGAILMTSLTFITSSQVHPQIHWGLGLQIRNLGHYIPSLTATIPLSLSQTSTFSKTLPLLWLLPCDLPRATRDTSMVRSWSLSSWSLGNLLPLLFFQPWSWAATGLSGQGTARSCFI